MSEMRGSQWPWYCWYSDKATGWMIRGSNPSKDKDFLFSKTGRSALGSTHYPILWIRELGGAK